jgi:hypothetical protein
MYLFLQTFILNAAARDSTHIGTRINAPAPQLCVSSFF